MDEGLGDPEIMKRTLDDFNNAALNPVGPVPGLGGAKLLNEINEMERLEGDQLTGER